MKRMSFALILISCCLLGLELNGSSATATLPSMALTRQAIELGIDAPTLGELWRNKQPVVISKPDASGQLHTTTYSLSPDEKSIIVRTDPEEPPAPKLDPIPITTSTTTPSPQTDWEYLPNSIGNRRTFTTTNLGSDWPSLGGSFPLLPGSRDYPSFGFPAGVTPHTQTKTEQDDQGNRVTTTIKTYGTPLFSTSSHSWSTGPQLSANWPSFSFPSGVTPQVTTKKEQDDQGNTVTTTTKVYKSTVPINWFPQTNGGLPESWQRRRDPFAEQRPQFSYGDFSPASNPSSSDPVSQSTPTFLPPLPTRPTLQAEVTPRTITTYNLDSLPTYRETNELPSDNTRVRTFTQSTYGLDPPTTSELTPEMRNLLDRGGITDEDINNARARGEDLVRTRTTPDGRKITTTVRVNSTPVLAPLPTAPPQTNVLYRSQTEAAAAAPAPAESSDKSIDNFLSQVNLKPSDILEHNGEVVKTIVDKDGRVLSARFVLSTAKGDEQGQGQGPPTK
ncbi:myb-like protein U [Drosophila albomicans]|uniref:Myb-like protein U n=1 Tax=Drosophila albomicans TaxID=7291 RepID=A0A6P8XLD6_DROAB|nr:myb-like protein U [Drosophila albomicans]